MTEPQPTPRYASEQTPYFSVDGYSARHHAQVLPSRIEAARVIHATIPQIADEAVARLVKYYERRGTPIPEDGLVYRRNLELTGHLLAGVVVGENVQQLEEHVLRHLVIEAEHGFELPDGNAMLFTFAVAAGREKLPEGPRRLFEGYAWHCAEYVRNGSAGAALSTRAHDLATKAYVRLAESVSQLEEEFGKETRQKCIRDLSMLLGAAPSWMATASRPLAAANALHWIFEHVAGEVPHFSARVWGPVFRHLWEVSVTELPGVHGQVAGDVFRSLARNAIRLREGHRVFARAREVARVAAYAACAGASGSAADVSVGARVADVYESLLERVAAAHTLRQSPAQSGVARHWLQFHANRLPKSDPAAAVHHARALRDTCRTHLRDACENGLEATLDAVVSASERFQQINARNELIPELSKRALGASGGAGPDLERRVSLFTSKCFEVSARGTLFETNDLLWTWQTYCLDPGDADPSEALARAYGALPGALASVGAADSLRHLHTYLEDVADTAKHLPAVRLLRGPEAVEIAREAIAAAKLRDRAIPPNELVFFLDRVAHAMLRAGTEAAITQLAWWYGSHVVAHHFVPEPHLHVDKLFSALSESVRKRLPEPSRQLFERVMDGFGTARPMLLAAPAIALHAPELARAAVAKFALTREWRDLVVGAQQARCERDLRLNLLLLANVARNAGPELDAELRAWGKEQLTQYLSDSTRKAVSFLLQHLEEVAREKLGEGVVAPMMQGLRSLYGQRAAW